MSGVVTLRVVAAHKFGVSRQHVYVLLRRAGTLNHLGVGRHHAHKPVLILVTDNDVTISDQNTGELLGTYQIEPNKNYWPNQTKEPDQRPGSNL